MKKTKTLVTKKTSWTCACLKNVEQNEGEGESSLARRETEADGDVTKHASGSLNSDWTVVAFVSLSVTLDRPTVVFIKIYYILV